MITFQDKKITEIINENYSYASVLYYFGIDIHTDSNYTLQEVCITKNIPIESVVKKLRLPISSFSISLQDTPLRLLIVYLKHHHHVFIKQRLSYIGKMIDKLPEVGNTALLEKDLKFIFPLFKEDFIHHVFDEEDTLFQYITTLIDAEESTNRLNKIFLTISSHSIESFSHEHHTQEDPMKGLREITKYYTIENSFSLLLKIIFTELSAFDSELQLHAQIENDILFPKALDLEIKIKQKIDQIAKLN